MIITTTLTGTLSSLGFFVTTMAVVIGFVATLALGSQLRQRPIKVRAKSEAQESHFMFPGV